MNKKISSTETNSKTIHMNTPHRPNRSKDRTTPGQVNQQSKTTLILLGIWLVGVLLFGGIINTSLHAADTPVTPLLNPDQQADLQRVWKYFGDLKTLTASFGQFSSDGSFASGQLYLHRPGRLRIEYKPPIPLLIIADGTRLVYYDTELNSASGFRLDETPASIFLSENFDPEKSGWIVTALEKKPGSLRLTLKHLHHPEYGRATLVFSDQPLELKKWQIRDVEGIETTVSLREIRRDVTLEDRLFIAKDPRALTNPFIR